MFKIIKNVLQSVREYKLVTLLTPLAMCGEVIMECILPFVVADLIDKGINGNSMPDIWKYGGILFVCAMISLLFGVTAGLTAAKASTGFAKNLRKDMYYKIQNFSFKNIDKFKTSSLVTRLTTDVQYVQQAFQMSIRIAVRAPLMLIFSFIMVVKINPSISTIFLVLIPVLLITLLIIGKSAFPLFDKVFKKYDDLNNVVEENVRSIRDVKSFTLEDEEIEKFEDRSNGIYKLFSKAEKIMALNSPAMQFAMYAALICICFFGSKIIISTTETELTTGNLTSLLTYTAQILSSVMMLSMMLVMSTIAIAAIKRIYEVLVEVPDIQNPKNPLNDVKDGSIEFKNVCFSYVDNKDKEVLKNINLKIKSGETIGIIGGTGDGKSTLVNLIPRLYDVTEGELLVGGNNVKDYDIKTLRENVSCVLQKNVLFAGTIKENLRWGNEDATDEEIIEACKLAQADKFINEFPDKYDTHIEQGGSNVSGGQKQRLCIARALLKKPKILILDDSTSAVDTKTDKLIRDAFNNKIPNTTKIIIAQRVASVENSDQIIVMKNGKIDGVGKHDELIKNNKIYKEVYESQTNMN